MEKSNLPLPLKKRTIGEAISVVRDGSKLEKRTPVQFKHGLVRDNSGRVLKDRPQFAGSYLKKRFGYSSKKTGVPFSLKGSKAVVTSLCAAGDFADACFPAFSESTDSALQESACVKRGSLSMKSKLLQLQERNRLILAKHQFPRTTSAPTQLNPDLTSAMLMTPLTLKVETTDEEVKTCSGEQVRLGESCSTSPIYHELDPIDGHVSSPEQHTYQSISEVREEMARLQAQMNFGNTTFASVEHNAANNCLKTAELSARESQKRIYGTVQEVEPKQSRTKRSIFSKFWLSRRNLLSTQEDATGDEKAVLTSITSLSEDEITAPKAGGEGLGNHPSGVGLCSQAHPSSIHSANSRKHPPNVTALSSWNAYSNHPLRTEDSYNTDGCQGFYIPTDSSCYSNARGICSNRDGIGNSCDCYYGWKSDDEVESDCRMGPTSQKTLLQSFAKRSDIKAAMKSKTKEEYFSSIEMANALTEYHWNVYQTGNIKKNETLATMSSSRRLDDSLDSPSKGAEVFIALHQDQWVTSHFLPAQLTPSDQSKAGAVLNMELDTSDIIYPHNVDSVFLHSRPSTSSSSFFTGKMSHSQFSSPSCGVRMAEMRAVRRKSESALLVEPSANIIPRSPIPRHSKHDEMLHHPPTMESSSPCTQSEPNHVSRNMHTILEEDQLMEAVASCHLEDYLPRSDPEIESGSGLSRHSEESSSQTEESPANPSTAEESDSLNTKAEECKIPEEEMLSSDGSINEVYEKKSGRDYLINVGASQTKQLTDSKTNGSRLKKPKPIKYCGAAAASSQTKQTNITGDCSLMLNLPAEQYTSSLKARKTENATTNTPLLFNSSRTIEREPKPLIRQALIRQIESVSSAQDVVGLELLESPRPQRTLQPTTRLKSGSYIPRTKNLFTNRTHSADDKLTRKICLRENESLRKRVDCQIQTKHLNHRSLEEATGLLTFSRSQSSEVAFKHREGKHLSCLYSDNSTSNTEMSNQCESTRNWTDQSQTPEVVVNCCPHNLECHDHKQITQLSCSGEYHVSEISSLSSSMTSSNSSSSVFGITESESESPTSSSTRDLQLELESPTSSSSSSRGRTEMQSNASVSIPAQDSMSKDVESTATKQPQSRGKSQLLAPRTDATRCLERLERLRIETKQTKNEFHQKLRH